MKTLLAVGCSFTEENFKSQVYPEMDCSWPKWPEIVGKKLGYNVVNLGKGGSSNDVIFKSAQDYIIDHKVDMICALWTQCTRLNIHDMNTVNWVHSFKDNTITAYSKRNVLNSKYFSGLLRRKHTALANEHLRNIYMLDQLCTHKNIPAYHMQGCESFIPTIIANEIQYDQRDDKVNKDYYNAFMHSKYFNLLENISERIWGWPFYEELGGASMSDYFYDNGEQNYCIGEKDTHPNAKGQRVIADKFMEIIK